MAATIRFPDGTEATIIDCRGTWVCDNEIIRENLQLRTEFLPPAYYPDPMNGIARAIAAQVGAEVIYTEPMESGDVPPGVDN